MLITYRSIMENSVHSSYEIGYYSKIRFNTFVVHDFNRVELI